MSENIITELVAGTVVTSGSLEGHTVTWQLVSDPLDSDAINGLTVLSSVGEVQEVMLSLNSHDLLN